MATEEEKKTDGKREHRCVFRRLCERLVAEDEMDELGDIDGVIVDARKALGKDQDFRSKQK